MLHRRAASCRAEGVAVPLSGSLPYPLPSSDSLTWRPLRLYCLYRLILAGLLAAVFFTNLADMPFGERAPTLFGVLCGGYLLFSLVAGFAVQRRAPGFGLQVFVQVLVDIIAITGMLYASGGIQSGLGILLVLAVAVGSLLTPWRLGFFFAAVATIALLFETWLGSIAATLARQSLTSTGLLGATLFLTAGIGYFLARRIREVEALAEQRGVDLANLSRLNEYVVQRLDSGILVVDEREQIHLMNDTAARLLAPPGEPRATTLQHLSPELLSQLRGWRLNQQRDPEPFQALGAGGEIQPRFTALGASRNGVTLIALEDASAVAQQAQQMKLASLGRLTASIAHEIRNPLGAISHAGQLLAESDALGQQDLRLTEIIQHHSQRMNQIIENVLQLSRRGPGQPQPFGLCDWLQEFVQELGKGEHLDEAALNLYCPHPPDSAEPQVFCDPTHLNQVLWNLCQNAVRYGTAEGAQPAVRIEAGLDDNELAFIDVIDQGPGISEADQAQMFEPFFTTSNEGTGLGLYLARELCECNRATLHYRREHDESRFRIRFAPLPEE